MDFSVSKIWKFKERYSAQFRVEFFNLFNRADFAAPGQTNPTAGLERGFGYATEYTGFGATQCLGQAARATSSSA